MILDSAAAIARGRAAMGRPDGAGMCLANNYAWWGSVQSIGPGAGQYDVALKGWTFAVKRHAGDWNPPAGVPVWFGVSPTRRDKNAAAGDVGLSLGNGYAIFTDSPNGTPGIMTLRARGAQIARPYLGWTEDFLGHDTQAGLQWAASRTPAVAVAIVTTAELQEKSMVSIVGISDGPQSGRALWVVDWGQKTKYNAAVGTLPSAGARIDVLKKMGVQVYDNQPSWLLSGFRDITKD